MKKILFCFTVLLIGSVVSFSLHAEEPKQAKKNRQSITGILTEVTKTSLTIRTQDGKELSYMRGFKLKMPEKVGKGSLVTIHINPILGVVKSIEPGTGKKQ